LIQNKLEQFIAPFGQVTQIIVILIEVHVKLPHVLSLRHSTHPNKQILIWCVEEEKFATVKSLTVRVTNVKVICQTLQPWVSL
jgi:hypothetical protein